MASFIPPKFNYKMDFHYWTNQMKNDWISTCDVSRRAANSISTVSAIEFSHFNHQELGIMKKMSLTTDELQKLQNASDLLNKEFAATVLTRATRQFLFQKLDKMYAYRTNVANELLTTEEHYVEQLKVLCEYIVKPIEEMQKKKKENEMMVKSMKAEKKRSVTPNLVQSELPSNAVKEEVIEPYLNEEQSRKIFSIIETLLRVNVEFLESFKDIVKQWNSESKIGGCFKKMIPFMKMYGDYCNNYNFALEELKKIPPDDAFYVFYTKQIKEFAPKEYKDYQIQSFLITPVQRIPRYKLLLGDLLKHTPQLHPDYKELKEAFDVVSDTAIRVNQISKEKEFIDKVQELTQLIQDLPENFSIQKAGRNYLKDGVCHVVYEKKFVPSHLILFSDVIIFCTHKESVMSSKLSKKFTYKIHFDITKVTTESVKQEELPKKSEIEASTSFKLISGQTQLVIGCSSAKEMKDWREAIKSTTEEETGKKRSVEDTQLQASKGKAEMARNIISYKYIYLGEATSRKWNERGKSFKVMQPMEKYRISEACKEGLKEFKRLTKRSDSADIQPIKENLD